MQQQQKRQAGAFAAQFPHAGLSFSNLPQPVFKQIVLQLLDDVLDRRRRNIRRLLLVSRKIHQATSDLLSIDTMDYAALARTTNPFQSPSSSSALPLPPQLILPQAAAHAFLVGLPDAASALIAQITEVPEVPEDIDDRLAKARSDLERFYAGLRERWNYRYVSALALPFAFVCSLRTRTL
ncbi:hypothetical protein PAPYR_2232 [Paratrimastix pyriformis]|uniref:F-box domain-containing protein n=1 Tax=Paratrimastix pyriformis TaxID=342808 RepID=A0ABQ8UUI7_9EUKA|nr:hypothetical protein PAPYR_2232 [Paratrimastix pyriformis]